jgi:general secretion pathway protein I
VRARGFTLLEVMVATAILGLTLTVILSAEGGLAASNKSTANVGRAISLSRCKMTEAEEKIFRYGFPLVDDIQTEQPCCNDEDVVGFKCDARTELILMPNPPSQSLDGGSMALSGAASPSAALSGLLPSDLPGALGGLGLGADAGSLGGLGLDGGLGSITMDGGLAALTQQMGGTGMGTQGLLSMVMGFVYPFIKPMMEASIRRITVTVRWKEGVRPKEFSLVQYVTNPNNGGFGPSPSASGSAGSPAASGAATTAAPGAVNTAATQPLGGVTQH